MESQQSRAHQFEWGPMPSVIGSTNKVASIMAECLATPGSGTSEINGPWPHMHLQAFRQLSTEVTQVLRDLSEAQSYDL